MIGVILCIVSVILARESKGLLVGEAATPEVVESVTSLALNEPAVIAVNQVLTLVFGPEEVLLNIEAQFVPSLRVSELAKVVSRLEVTIQRYHPHVKRIFIEVAPRGSGRPTIRRGRDGSLFHASYIFGPFMPVRMEFDS